MKNHNKNIVQSIFLNLETFVFGLILALILMEFVEAREHILATITNDEIPNKMILVLETDDANQQILFLHKDTFHVNNKSKRIHRKTTNIKNVGNHGLRKIVLEQQGKYEVVTLTSENFALHNGGNLIMNTLYNGATGKHKKYSLELTRHRDSWALLRNEKRIYSIHFISKKLPVVGTVGVSNIITK